MKTKMLKNFSYNKKIFFTISFLSILFILFNFETKYDKQNEASEFRLNPEWSICDKLPQTKTYLFIAFVIIAPHQFEQRNHIRNTWANKQFSNDMKVIFTVALSKNQTVNELLVDEFHLYGDILQIKTMIDSYYNCTIKIMKTYKWITKYCSNTKYILKICDDVVVNTPELINNFKSVIAYKTNHIYGFGWYGAKPIRDPSNKWYVSEKEFNGTSYDPYVAGKLFRFVKIDQNLYFYSSQDF